MGSIERRLKRLKDIGVHGVMADMWYVSEKNIIMTIIRFVIIDIIPVNIPVRYVNKCNLNIIKITLSLCFFFLLSSELGTNKTVTAIFWPWLSGQGP